MSHLYTRQSVVASFLIIFLPYYSIPLCDEADTPSVNVVPVSPLASAPSVRSLFR